MKMKFNRELADILREEISENSTVLLEDEMLDVYDMSDAEIIEAYANGTLLEDQTVLLEANAATANDIIKKAEKGTKGKMPGALKTAIKFLVGAGAVAGAGILGVKYHSIYTKQAAGMKKAADKMLKGKSKLWAENAKKSKEYKKLMKGPSHTKVVKAVMKNMKGHVYSALRKVKNGGKSVWDRIKGVFTKSKK